MTGSGQNFGFTQALKCFGYKLMTIKILALETSADACSVALLSNKNIIDRYQVAPRQHAQLLLNMVQEVLAEAELNLTDLEAIAFGCGPGSFTGLRIACSAAQGLAFGSNLPVVAVSSLQALAQGAYEEEGLDQVLAGVDAKMQEIYFGIYKLAADNLMQPLQTDKLVKPEELIIPSESGWIGVGDAWQVYSQQFKTISYFYPKARHVAKLARAAYAAGKAVTAESAQPVYLRSEKAWQKN
jgi:tRNA threonylcarbamoyladenosine biosynthesis protein TsaB